MTLTSLLLPTSVYTTALQAKISGMSVVPICANGTKRPAVSRWREYQRRLASATEVKHWFSKTDVDVGIGLITGTVSQNLEALDFDDFSTFEAWLEHMQQNQVLAALYEQLAQGYLEETPSGGRHLLYRCEGGIEGNQKLACRLDGTIRKTLIETRGEGGLIIIAPSHGHVHPSGKPYTLLHGSVSSIRTITTQQRASLLAAARDLDEIPPVDHYSCIPCIPKSPQYRSSSAAGQRPGDLFNQCTTWEEVLAPHGWQLVYTRGNVGYWRRPGKDDEGISATTNYAERDWLYVFSTSTCFEAQRVYSKFGAYALLNHQGDFSAAARELARAA